MTSVAFEVVKTIEAASEAGLQPTARRAVATASFTEQQLSPRLRRQLIFGGISPDTYPATSFGDW
jgi:hypothetical protein